jgi:protein MBA1
VTVPRISILRPGTTSLFSIRFAMASTVRLPAGTSARIVPSGSFVQCRAFSETSQQWRGRPMNFRSPSQAQPSFNTRTQGMKLSDLPNDIGILPGTFVRPLWRDMPSIFKAPRDRWHMEWTWLKSLATNYGRLVLPKSSEYSAPSIALVVIMLNRSYIYHILAGIIFFLTIL